MKKYGFSVILTILWVVLLVAPVAANRYEGGTVPGGYSHHQENSTVDGYAIDPYDRTVSAKAEAKATVNVYQQAPPAPHYNRPRHHTAPRPRVKRPAYQAPRHTTYRAPVRPKAKPGKPFLTNKAGGSAFGVGVPNSTIAVTPNGVVVKVMKGIMSGRPGSEWQWAAPGRTLNINRPIGSLLRFIVAVRNTDSSDLPTDGIYVRDDLASKLNSKAESGALFIGATKIRDLTSEELTELTSGTKIPVKQYIDTIPAKGTLGIRYDVRIAGGTSESQDSQTIVPTNDDPSATGTSGPSSKVVDGQKKFDRRWLLWPILIIVLIWIARILWQMLHRPRVNDDNDEPEPYGHSPIPPAAPAAPPVAPSTPPAPPLVVEVEDDEPALTIEEMEEAARRGTI